MVKKVLSCLLIGIICLNLVACNGAAEEEEAPAAPQPTGEATLSSGNTGKNLATDTFKIAYVAADIGTDNNQKWDQGAQLALAGYGDRCTYTTWDCKGDASTQNQIIDELVAQEYDGIFLDTVDTTAVAASVQKAEEAGTNVVTINHLIDSITYTGNIGMDFYSVYADTARVVGDALGEGGGKVVIIAMPVELRSVMPLDGLYDTFANEYTNIEVIDEVSGDWSVESGNQVMRDFITKYGADGIDAVVTCNDNMALGAIQALEANSISGCVIVGNDGIDGALEAIKDGKMTATLQQDSVNNGQVAVTLLLEAIATGFKGNELSHTPEIHRVLTEINQSNVDNFYTSE